MKHLHIEIKKGAIATFTKKPTKKVLKMLRKMVELAEEKFKDKDHNEKT